MADTCRDCPFRLNFAAPMGEPVDDGDLDSWTSEIQPRTCHATDHMTPCRGAAAYLEGRSTVTREHLEVWWMRGELMELALRGRQ